MAFYEEARRPACGKEDPATDILFMPCAGYILMASKPTADWGGYPLVLSYLLLQDRLRGGDPLLVAVGIYSSFPGLL